MNFLIGTYRKVNSEGIYQAKLDNNRLKTEVLYIASLPSYLDWFNNTVFAISKFGIEIFKDGHVIFKDNSQLKAPSHITFDNKYNFIYTTGYHSGDLIKYMYEGERSKIVEVINFGQKSHPHQTYIDDERALIYVPLLGSDEVRVFKHNKLNFELVKTIKFPVGFGPRHVVKYGSSIYVAGELGRQVGVINSSFEISQITESFHNKEGSGFSAIRVHPSKPYLYVSNREDNSIIVFSINEDESLKLKQVYLTNYDHARDFDITPDGKTLIAGFLNSNIVVSFKLGSDGLIKEESFSSPVLEPTSITFQRK